ncbi:hypothetical protein [Paenibacillus sp. BJ-4]|nr:hypothetical protein [Paenibacillus sp. BJ-4]
MEKSYDNIDQLKRYYTLTHAQKRIWWIGRQVVPAWKGYAM